MPKGKDKATPTPAYYDPAEFVLVHADYLARLRDPGWMETERKRLATLIAARLGRADAWPKVLDILRGDLGPADQSTRVKAPSLDA